MIGNQSKYDTYFKISSIHVISEFVIEYKLTKNMEKTKLSSAKDAIKQIIENKYYEKFQKQEKSKKFIIGVGFNPFSKEIISEIIIKQFFGFNFDFWKGEDWKTIFVKGVGIFD